MAQLLKHTRDSEGKPGWAILSLDGITAAQLERRDGKLNLKPLDAATGAEGAITLLQCARAGQEGWALLTDVDAVRINGDAPLLGIHLLADRDEIRLPGGERVFYSTERATRTENMPDLGRTIECPVCLLEIRPGDPAARCSHCGVWYHQMPDDRERELPCYTTASNCRSCRQPLPDLAGGFAWTPEELYRHG